MKNMFKSVMAFGLSGCLITLFIRSLIGYFLIDYITNTAFHHNLPWWQDILISLIGTELSIFLAIVTFAMNIMGYPFPIHF